jgi:hypothetical protein
MYVDCVDYRYTKAARQETTGRDLDQDRLETETGAVMERDESVVNHPHRNFPSFVVDEGNYLGRYRLLSSSLAAC